jgi:WD40 repeat protein
VAGNTLGPDEPVTLSGHTAAVFTVAWSSDGRRLVTASRDHTSRVYLVDVDDLAALARTRLTRGLTAEECQKYLHAPACPD